MFRTIVVSDYIQIQGEFVRACRDGQIIVRNGTTDYRGWPVAQAV